MFNLDNKLSKKEVNNINIINLAFIGDAVYTLYIRENLVLLKDEKGNELNKKASLRVCATSQSKTIEKLMPYLTEEEISVFKRGRNAKKTTHSKSADIKDYVKSTGFEALIGYLYLIGEEERLKYILNLGEQNED